jgi:hypothetical protein
MFIAEEERFMKWFKHMTDMLDDAFVSQLIDNYGIAGYGMWCGVLETYAKYCKERPGDFVEIPWRPLTHKLRTGRAKVERLLADCAAHSKIMLKNNPQNLEIAIPKMSSLSDEWTSRMKKASGVDREPLGPRSDQDPDPEIKQSPLTPLPGGECAEKHDQKSNAFSYFEAFWKVYPKKVARPLAFRAWHRQEADSRFDEIMAGLARCKSSERWRTENGRYIPKPSVFLFREGWQDELPPADSDLSLTAKKPRWRILQEADRVEDCWDPDKKYNLSDWHYDKTGCHFRKGPLTLNVSDLRVSLPEPSPRLGAREHY